MDTYAFLLDLFPLTEEIAEYSPAIAFKIAEVAFDLLLESVDAQKHLQDLELLLRLSCDLGYLSPEILAFLQEELRRLQ